MNNNWWNDLAQEELQFITQSLFYAEFTFTGVSIVAECGNYFMHVRLHHCSILLLSFDRRFECNHSLVGQ